MRKTFHTTRETISSHVRRNMAEYLIRSNARKHAAKIELKFCNTKRRVEDEDDEENKPFIEQSIHGSHESWKSTEKANIMTVNSHAIASAESGLGKKLLLAPKLVALHPQDKLGKHLHQEAVQTDQDTRQRTEMRTKELNERDKRMRHE